MNLVHDLSNRKADVEVYATATRLCCRLLYTASYTDVANLFQRTFIVVYVRQST